MTKKNTQFKYTLILLAMAEKKRKNKKGSIINSTYRYAVPLSKVDFREIKYKHLIINIKITFKTNSAILSVLIRWS